VKEQQDGRKPEPHARRLVRRVTTTTEVFECPVDRGLEDVVMMSNTDGSLDGGPVIDEGCKCVSTQTIVDERDDDGNGDVND
jgi:hypothetical protein